MKQLDFINKRLREQNKVRAYINNTNEAMLEYHQIFPKKIKPLLPEPQLFHFYHPLETQKMVNYYLLQWVQALQHMLYTSTLNKVTDEEKLYQAYYQPDRLWTGGRAIKELHKIMSMSKKTSNLG